MNVEPSPGLEVVRGGAVWALLGGPPRVPTWRRGEPSSPEPPPPPATQVQAINVSSRFEEEIKAEQEERKKQAEEMKQRKAAFKELQSTFK